MRTPRICWIDPAFDAAAPAVQALARHGYDIEAHGSGAEALARLEAAPADLVIVDVALIPEGLALCRRLATEQAAPVLVFSAQAEPLDRVDALEQGADDVLPKSAHALEFSARVRALLRRQAKGARLRPAPTSPVWELDMRTGVLMGPGERLMKLSAGDAALLGAFLVRPQEVLTRAELEAILYGAPGRVGRRTVDVRIVRLRQQLDQCDGAGAVIKTLRGGGYVFDPEGPVKLMLRIRSNNLA